MESGIVRTTAQYSVLFQEASLTTEEGAGSHSKKSRHSTSSACWINATRLLAVNSIAQDRVRFLAADRESDELGLWPPLCSL